MEPSCIRQTALPNITKLFGDFTYHPDRVAEFYPYLPLQPGSFRRAAEQIEFSPEQRRNLVAALRIQNHGNPLLDRLAQAGTVAVVTGQQVGLFSGPLYTIYKALTAIRLAENLTVDGIPAVPIFWLATEDHDFPEVNQAWLFDDAHRAVRFEAQAAPKANQPVGGVVIESVDLEQVSKTLAGLPYAEEAFELIRSTYRPGVAFGEAFAALLGRLLEGFPILRVDPMLPEFRALAAPLLSKAVTKAPALTAAILQRNKELNAAGYHAQVHVEQSTSLFFRLRDGQRLALRRHNGDYFEGKEKISARELADHPEQLSPNALLRPVVQDSMIPTIAYVGGPAELAYLAQSEVLYRNLLGRQPIAVHRASFTLLDARAAKLLERYRLELPDFFHGEEAVRQKASRMLVDPGLAARIDETRATAVTSLERMASELKNFDPSITKALEKSRRKIEYQFGKIARKVGRQAVIRDERAGRDICALTDSLFPRHRLQERLYSAPALIAQHGPDLVRYVYDHVTLECPDHQVLA